MEKKQIYIDDVYEYDYEYNEEKRIHILYYSNGEQWSDSFKTKKVLSITDTGDEIIVNEVKKGKYDYHRAVCLAILLKIIHKEYKFEMSNSERIAF